MIVRRFGLIIAAALLIPGQAAGQLVDEVSVYVTGGKSVTNWHGQADLHTINLELVHRKSPRTDLAVVVAPSNVWQPRSWFGYSYGNGNEAVRALSASLLIRRRFGEESSLRQWYVEAATGPMIAEKRVPAATSRFNFITQFGAGVIIGPSRRVPLYLGYRYAHISNGGYSERNPGLNISSLLVGTRVRLGR